MDATTAPPQAPVEMGDADLSAVGALLADPGRCRMLLALGDGRELPASVLAGEAGVSPATASTHLTRLVDAGLLTVRPLGRYRYYRLSGPAVGELIEVLARLAPPRPVRSLREGTRAHALRYARRCYDHLAGRVGVAVTAALIEQGALTGHDGHVDLRRMNGPRPAGGVLDPIGYTLTSQGEELLGALGLVPPKSPVVRCCVDWTEQRHHVSGPLGRVLLERFLDLGWFERTRNTRALRLTPLGAEGLREHLGAIVPESRRSAR